MKNLNVGNWFDGTETPSFELWWADNEKTFLEHSLYMSEVVMAQVIWKACMTYFEVQSMNANEIQYKG